MIKAVIFDMDGLMFDTERLWLDSVKETNRVYGYNVPESLIIDCMGKRADKIDEKLKEQLGQDFDTAKFREYNDFFMDKDVAEHGLRIKKGLKELIAYLKQNGIKMAVASSSKMKKVDKRFRQAGMGTEDFEVIISGDMINNPKPHPEIYEKACALLNVTPAETISLEDSQNGLLSAINAGVRAVWVPDIKIPSQEVLDKVYKKLNSLDEMINFLEQEKTQNK